MNDYESYVRGTCPLPETNTAWPLYGTGLENLGRNRQPVDWELPECGPDDLLARVDACGLCFSDIKVLRLGPEHPRISGRDLENDPVILGHEVALTIVQVGDNRAGEFEVGDRFVVQADIYYRGEGLAFGYALHGGLEQFVRIGPPILDGDDGCYLIPIPDEIGYSEAALAEPWACVECAFRVETRRRFAEGGVLAIVAGPHPRPEFTLGDLLEQARPSYVVTAGAPRGIMQEIEASGIEHAELSDTEQLSTVAGQRDGIDDLVLLDPTADQVEELATLLADGGVLCLMIDEPLTRPVAVDAGRVHYDGTRYVGASGLDVSEAYAATRSVKPVEDGRMLVVGAAGPMGQMHVQRALEHPDGPLLVVATDIDDERLATLPARYGTLAEENGRELVTLNPAALGPVAAAEQMAELAPEGFDDVIVLVPAPPVIAGSAEHLGDRGMYNIFAGVARGTMVEIDVSDVALRGVRYTGTSGSAIEDLRATIRMSESGELAPNRAVAAIGGIEAAWEGLQAVQEGELTGKAVIYPHVRDLPLTLLDDLAGAEPEVAAKLDASGAWTREAEAELLRRHVHGCGTSGGGRACRHLEGKVALVTGAAQGLGEALAVRLAREGASVCIADINLEGARATAERITEATRAQAFAVEMDVTDEDSVRAAIDACAEKLGGLDIVVSNAGILIAGATPEFEVADWRRVIEVNLVGYFIVAKHAARKMLELGTKGAIVQINSKSGKKGSFRNSAYASSKFGGIGLTQSLALEFAEEGIRVNSICPGNLLDSPLWVDSLYGQYAERWGITEEEVRQKYVDQVPMKRGCTYDDVANVLVFLASDQASYMTGQAINVTGGQIMH